MKKYSIKFLPVIVFNLIVCVLPAQTKSLSIGDEVPDVVLKNIVNYTSSQARLSDFTNKLLILDFWATWCAPCVSMLPVCDSLQKKFNNDIQILPVAEEGKTTIINFINNIQRVKHISFPSVTGDTVLSKMFVHTEIPHYVWIDKNKKVIAITGAEALTGSTISGYLNSGIINVAVKQDDFKQINEKQLMFKAANKLIKDDETTIDVIPDNDVFYHSIITGYINGFGCEGGGDTDRLICQNYSIGGLYRFALGGTDIKKAYLNSTVWQVINPDILAFTDSANMSQKTITASDDWMKRHSFCYELKCPNTSFEKRSSIMLHELNNYFGALYDIEGSAEIINTKILALVKTNESSSFTTKGITEKSVVNSFYLKIKNQPVSTLLNFLGFQLDWLPPLQDETGYKGNIDVELNCDLSNLEDINKALLNYGLQLQEKIESREMIVIKDKK